MAVVAAVAARCHPWLKLPPGDGQPPAATQSAFSGTRTQNTSVIAQGAQSLASLIQQDDTTLFGSVVQTITSGLSDVSGVDTSFDGNQFTLQINHQNGSSTTLDTDRGDVYIIDEYTSSENPVTDRPAVDGYIVGSSNSRATVASVTVEWSNTDFADYLAGGYWLHVDLGAPGIEIGAFIDGPDYGSVVDVPATGTATYNGRVAGVYMSSYGTDVATAELPVGSLELGEYAGDLNLFADFGTNSISGNIDNIDLFYIYAFAPNGNVFELFDEPSSGYELIFGTTPINPNGQFTGNSVMLTHPTISLSSSRGSWAGRFSTRDDSSLPTCGSRYAQRVCCDSWRK